METNVQNFNLVELAPQNHNQGKKKYKLRQIDPSRMSRQNAVIILEQIIPFGIYCVVS